MDTIEIAQRVRVAKLRPLLEWHEKQIEMAGQGLAKAFKNLKEDSEKPYLLTHASFDLYCADRWGMTTRRVQQMLAGETMRLQLMEEAPEMAPRIDGMKERAIREIVTTPPEKRMEVLREAVKTPGKVTAAKLQQLKKKVLAPMDAEYKELPSSPPCCPPCCPTCNRPL